MHVLFSSSTGDSRGIYLVSEATGLVDAFFFSRRLPGKTSPLLSITVVSIIPVAAGFCLSYAQRGAG